MGRDAADQAGPERGVVQGVEIVPGNLCAGGVHV